MTQKQALVHVLEYAQRHFEGEGNTMIAARAAFVVLWLQDINWHSEARALNDRTLASPRLKAPFEKIERDVKTTGELQKAAVLFSWIFGWGLTRDAWQATKGAPLVKELWDIINTLP